MVKLAPRLLAAAFLLLGSGEIPSAAAPKQAATEEIDTQEGPPAKYQWGAKHVLVTRISGQDVLRNEVEVPPHFWPFLENHQKDFFTKADYKETTWKYFGVEMFKATTKAADKAGAEFESLKAEMEAEAKWISDQEKRKQPFLYADAVNEKDPRIAAVEKELGKEFCKPLREQQDSLRIQRHQTFEALSEEDRKKGKELAAKVAGKTKQKEIQQYTVKMKGKDLEGGYGGGRTAFDGGGPREKRDLGAAGRSGAQSLGTGARVAGAGVVGKIGDVKTKYKPEAKEQPKELAKKGEEKGFFGKLWDGIKKVPLPVWTGLGGAVVGGLIGGGKGALIGAGGGAVLGLGIGALTRMNEPVTHKNVRELEAKQEDAADREGDITKRAKEIQAKDQKYAAEEEKARKKAGQALENSQLADSKIKEINEKLKDAPNLGEKETKKLFEERKAWEKEKKDQEEIRKKAAAEEQAALDKRMKYAEDVRPEIREMADDKWGVLQQKQELKPQLEEARLKQRWDDEKRALEKKDPAAASDFPAYSQWKAQQAGEPQAVKEAAPAVPKMGKVEGTQKAYNEAEHVEFASPKSQPKGGELNQEPKTPAEKKIQAAAKESVGKEKEKPLAEVVPGNLTECLRFQRLVDECSNTPSSVWNPGTWAEAVKYAANRGPCARLEQFENANPSVTPNKCGEALRYANSHRMR